MSEIEWHPASAGGMLHAVIRGEHFPNRTSLCFMPCELPPYPKHVEKAMAKRKRVQKCSNCLRKMQARTQEGEGGKV